MKHGARNITSDIATVASLMAILNTSITEIHSPKSSIASCIVGHVGTRLPVINAWYHTAPAGIRLFEHASLSILPRCAVSPGTAMAPITSSFPLRAPSQLDNNVFYTGPPSEKRRALLHPALTRDRTLTNSWQRRLSKSSGLEMRCGFGWARRHRRR